MLERECAFLEILFDSTYKRLATVVRSPLALRQVPYPDIFETHIAVPSRVQL